MTTEATTRRFRSQWRIPGRIEEVAEILRDVAGLPKWWGDVYLAAEILAPGDDKGVGRRVRFHSRGFLPYTLKWEGLVTEADPPHGWAIAAKGDLAGRGIWRLRQEVGIADICFDWEVAVEKPALRTLAPLLWAAYAANHRWAMARGEQGLILELKRRRRRAG